MVFYLDRQTLETGFFGQTLNRSPIVLVLVIDL
jgi:hypothetical protein